MKGQDFYLLVKPTLDTLSEKEKVALCQEGKGEKKESRSNTYPTGNKKKFTKNNV